MNSSASNTGLTQRDKVNLLSFGISLISAHNCPRSYPGGNIYDFIPFGGYDHEVLEETVSPTDIDSYHHSTHYFGDYYCWNRLGSVGDSKWGTYDSDSYGHPDIKILKVDDLIGLFVVSALVLQMLLGYYHHYRYVRDKPTERRWFTYVHMTSGFLLVTCGIFNGGGGLTLAQVPSVYVSLWWAFSSILPICYLVVCIGQCCIARSRNGGASQGTPADSVAVDPHQSEPQELQSIDPN